LSKAKVKTVDSVTLYYNQYQDKENPNLKVQVIHGYFNSAKYIGTLWVPRNTVDKLGFLDFNIVKARIKHDFKLDVQSYGAATYYIDTDKLPKFDFNS
jgi:hypothetical protein